MINSCLHLLRWRQHSPSLDPKARIVVELFHCTGELVGMLSHLSLPSIWELLELLRGVAPPHPFRLLTNGIFTGMADAIPVLHIP